LQSGIKVAIDPLLNFWGNDYFLTYFDERNASVSSNVHALSALRFDMEKDCNQKRLAEQVTEWIRNNFKVTAFFDDKWHISPFYTTAHAIHALAGWDNELACTCINYLLMNQDEESGGWGFWNKPTLEETSHVVLALLSARKSGLLTDDTPLQRAASFFQSQGLNRPTERLWIGKTLYCPIGVVQGTVAAAKFGLSNLGFSAFNPGIGIFQNEASI
jgi:halimadienyl-diphosphate synthase